jgi:hypothetical protein
MRMVSDKRRSHSTMDTLPKAILGKLSRNEFNTALPAILRALKGRLNRQ